VNTPFEKKKMGVW